MSRGTRFITLAIPLTIIYLLMLIGILPVPLVSQELADQILPVVSPSLPQMTRRSAQLPIYICADTTDPILAAGDFRIVLTYFARSWTTAVQRLSRGLRESAEGD